MVVRAVRTAVASGADPVIVVTGAHRSLVEDALTDERECSSQQSETQLQPTLGKRPVHQRPGRSRGTWISGGGSRSFYRSTSHSYHQDC